MVALANSIPASVETDFGQIQFPPAIQLVGLPPTPVALVFAEVVHHPRGGWTIAQPIDATKSTIRNYEGWWATKAAAVAALDGRYRS